MSVAELSGKPSASGQFTEAPARPSGPMYGLGECQACHGHLCITGCRADHVHTPECTGARYVACERCGDIQWNHPETKAFEKYLKEQQASQPKEPPKDTLESTYSFPQRIIALEKQFAEQEKRLKALEWAQKKKDDKAK
jgi:hypothetical protein